MQPSCIGDGHPWESLLSTVRAWLRVSTQACNQGQIQVELVHQPILERSLFSKRFVHIVELQIKWKNLSQSKILGGVLQVKHLCVYIYTYIYCICLTTLFNSSDPIHRDSLKGFNPHKRPNSAQQDSTSAALFTHSTLANSGFFAPPFKVSATKMS